MTKYCMQYNESLISMRLELLDFDHDGFRQLMIDLLTVNCNAIVTACDTVSTLIQNYSNGLKCYSSIFTPIGSTLSNAGSALFFSNHTSSAACAIKQINKAAALYSGNNKHFFCKKADGAIHILPLIYIGVGVIVFVAVLALLQVIRHRLHVDQSKNNGKREESEQLMSPTACR